MNKLVTLDQEMKLKKFGFDLLTEFQYHNTELVKLRKRNEDDEFYISAPTVDDALDWIREEKVIVCGVYPECWPKIEDAPNGKLKIDYTFEGYSYNILDKSSPIAEHINVKTFDTHPLANSALLTAVLEYLIGKEK